jgi:hypothetical protein
MEGTYVALLPFSAIGLGLVGLPAALPTQDRNRHKYRAGRYS